LSSQKEKNPNRIRFFNSVKMQIKPSHFLNCFCRDTKNNFFSFTSIKSGDFLSYFLCNMVLTFTFFLRAIKYFHSKRMSSIAHSIRFHVHSTKRSILNPSFRTMCNFCQMMAPVTICANFFLIPLANFSPLYTIVNLVRKRSQEHVA